MKKLAIVIIAVIVVLGVIVYLVKEKSINQKTPVVSSQVQEKDSSKSSTSEPTILPWLTKENLITGHLNDNSLGIGNTQKQVVDQLGKPDLTGNYEGAYYKYNHKMIFFFSQSLPENIKESDPIAKLMLDTDGMKITKKLLDKRLGKPIEEGISEIDDEKYIAYSLDKYNLISNLDEKDKIISLELYLAHH